MAHRTLAKTRMSLSCSCSTCRDSRLVQTDLAYTSRGRIAVGTGNATIGSGLGVFRTVESYGGSARLGELVLPHETDGLGRIRTGDLRCVRATS
jgi:hypothetical protein